MNRRTMKSTALSALALGAVVGTSLIAVNAGHLTAFAKTGDKVYTKTFKATSAEKVLDWMRREGIKLELDDLPSLDRELTLVFEGADEQGVVNTFAKTMGLQAVKRGDVYSLMRGADTAPTDDDMDDDEFDVPEPVIASEFDLMQDTDGDDLVSDIVSALKESGVSQSVIEKVKARLEERLSHKNKFFFKGPGRWSEKVVVPDMKGFKFEMPDMKEFKVPMPNPEEMKLNLEPGHQQGVMQALERARIAIERAMQELHGTRGTFMSPEGRQFHFEFDKEAMKQHTEEMQKHLKEQDRHRIEMKELEKQFGEGGKFKFEMDKMHKELGENMKVLKIKMENLKKFVKSLTPEQKKLADKQGYLRPEDLTKEQRELLDIVDKKDVDMNFNLDGDSIRIKSGKAEKAKAAIGA